MAKVSLNIDIQLEGSNYRKWAFSVKTVINATSYGDHLIDDLDAKADEATIKSWKKADAKVMGTLILNLVPSLRMSLEHHTYAKEIWNYLEKRYLQPSGALEYSLLQNLHGIEQDEMSVEEFYGLFTRITRQLASMVPKSSPGCTSCAAKEKHDEQMLMLCFVMGLR